MVVAPMLGCRHRCSLSPRGVATPPLPGARNPARWTRPLPSSSPVPPTRPETAVAGRAVVSQSLPCSLLCFHRGQGEEEEDMGQAGPLLPAGPHPSAPPR
ncbi:hypothetical protein VPH35_038875 [Triticum aestivum]